MAVDLDGVVRPIFDPIVPFFGFVSRFLDLVKISICSQSCTTTPARKNLAN
jgi:hypothetical protein